MKSIKPTKSTFLIYLILIPMCALSLNCTTIQLLSPNDAIITTITSTPKVVLPPTASNTPIKELIPNVIGTWNFTVYGGPWEASGMNRFYITFKQDGTLIYLYKFIGPGEPGIWTQKGNNIHFEISNFSFWDGMVEGKRMSGTVTNKDGESGTWSAIYKP